MSERGTWEGIAQTRVCTSTQGPTGNPIKPNPHFFYIYLFREVYVVARVLSAPTHLTLTIPFFSIFII